MEREVGVLSRAADRGYQCYTEPVVERQSTVAGALAVGAAMYEVGGSERVSLGNVDLLSLALRSP